MPPMFTPFNPRRMQPDPPPDEDSFMQALLGTRPNRDAFRQHVESTPQREDFKQGAFQKILTALAAAGAGATGGAKAGLDVVSQFRDRPFQEALALHGQKGAMLRDLSEDETSDIKLRAGLLENKMDRGLRSRGMDITERGQSQDLKLREQEQALRARGLDQEADQIALKREALSEEHRSNLANESTRRISADADMMRAKAYPGLGGVGRVRPESRIPVNQYDDARMMAIEELLAKDPNAQYYFQGEEKGGQPTGNYFPIMKRSRMLGMGSRDLEPGEREALRVYMEQIDRRAKQLAGQSVDLYDRSRER